MNFLAIFLALLLEQARPLSKSNPVHKGIRGWARWVRRTLDAGQNPHAWWAWSLASLGPTLASAGVYLGLLQLNVVLAFAWVVVVLYATLGFRQFSHHFTHIRDALEAGDERAARAALAEWRQVDVNELPRQEILRHVIEYSVISAHRHVFGVLVFFVVFSVLGLGPAGAVLYRLAEHLQRVWRERPQDAPSPALQAVASQTWRWLDAIPARVTALGFAIAGNFEEAVAAWRQDVQQFSDPNDGVILASTSGAINVRLGGRSLEQGSEQETGVTATDGREPQLAHLASVVGLVWRSVVLWLLLLVLVTIASIVG